MHICLLQDCRLCTCVTTHSDVSPHANFARRAVAYQKTGVSASFVSYVFAGSKTRMLTHMFTDMTAALPFHYTEFAPSAAVNNVALTYWGFTVRVLPHDGFMHRVWPDGCVSLVFIRAVVEGNGRIVDARIAGPRVAPLDIPVFAGACYWGVRFRPEAGAASLGMSATTLRDANLTIDAHMSGLEELRARLAPFGATDDADATMQVARIFDAWITSRTRALASTATNIDAGVRDAVAAIVATNSVVPIIQIAELTQMTMRSLQRRFRDATGLTPKEFANVRRGRALMKRVVGGEADASEGGWSGLAHVAGYADQSHLVRELGRLTQFTLTALRHRLLTIDHGRIID